MTAQIERLASQAATQALNVGQPQLAAEAATQGLLAVPGSPGLWRLRQIAAQNGSGENRDYIEARAKAEIGDDVLLNTRLQDV
jgi:hypothetical protein